MEFKQFEEIFKDAGFTPRQIKKLQRRAYKEYEDANGKKIATGGQKQMSYDFLITYLRELSNGELVDEMQGICKASREQSERLYTALEQR